MYGQRPVRRGHRAGRCRSPVETFHALQRPADLRRRSPTPADPARPGQPAQLGRQGRPDGPLPAAADATARDAAGRRGDGRDARREAVVLQAASCACSYPDAALLAPAADRCGAAVDELPPATAANG